MISRGPFGNYNNDIALLELKPSLTFSDVITAICAPNPDEDYTGFDSIVAGWGNVIDSGGMFFFSKELTLVNLRVQTILVGIIF